MFCDLSLSLLPVHPEGNCPWPRSVHLGHSVGHGSPAQVAGRSASFSCSMHVELFISASDALYQAGRLRLPGSLVDCDSTASFSMMGECHDGLSPM